MADNNDLSLGCSWENSIIRKALVEIGDEESLREFDEEQEKMRKEAEEEFEQMKREGLILV